MGEIESFRNRRRKKISRVLLWANGLWTLASCKCKKTKDHRGGVASCHSGPNHKEKMMTKKEKNDEIRQYLSDAMEAVRCAKDIEERAIGKENLEIVKDAIGITLKSYEEEAYKIN